MSELLEMGKTVLESRSFSNLLGANAKCTPLVRVESC